MIAILTFEKGKKNLVYSILKIKPLETEEL